MVKLSFRSFSEFNIYRFIMPTKTYFDMLNTSPYQWEHIREMAARTLGSKHDDYFKDLPDLPKAGDDHILDYIVRSPTVQHFAQQHKHIADSQKGGGFIKTWNRIGNKLGPAKHLALSFFPLVGQADMMISAGTRIAQAVKQGKQRKKGGNIGGGALKGGTVGGGNIGGGALKGGTVGGGALKTMDKAQPLQINKENKAVGSGFAKGSLSGGAELGKGMGGSEIPHNMTTTMNVLSGHTASGMNSQPALTGMGLDDTGGVFKGGNIGGGDFKLKKWKPRIVPTGIFHNENEGRRVDPMTGRYMDHKKGDNPLTGGNIGGGALKGGNLGIPKRQGAIDGTTNKIFPPHALTKLVRELREARGSHSPVEDEPPTGGSFKVDEIFDALKTNRKYLKPLQGTPWDVTKHIGFINWMHSPKDTSFTKPFKNKLRDMTLGLGNHEFDLIKNTAATLAGAKKELGHRELLKGVERNPMVNRRHYMNIAASSSPSDLHKRLKNAGGSFTSSMKHTMSAAAWSLRKNIGNMAYGLESLDTTAQGAKEMHKAWNLNASDSEWAEQNPSLAWYNGLLHVAAIATKPLQGYGDDDEAPPTTEEEPSIENAEEAPPAVEPNRDNAMNLLFEQKKDD